MESDVYARQGFGAAVGGGERPALLIVDFVEAFVDPEVLGGGNIEAAVAATLPVLRACREQSWPVVFTRIVYAEDGSDVGLWATKLPALQKLTAGSPMNRVVEALAPLPGELVIDKKQASAFFGTDLAPWLVQRRVDTLYVAGCTTSGCVRASVVDAMSWNFRPIVIEDCVGDRALEPHAANLFDMRQKYADLVTAEAAVRAMAARA